MKLVIQRVSEASVNVGGNTIGKIDQGLLVFAGIEDADTTEDLEWTAKKVAGMRIFSDQEGKMNCDVKEVNGALLVVSQFTLHASTKKGNRPSFIKAGAPEFAQKMLQDFVQILKLKYALPVEEGQFGADMQVRLINDGPVTITMDSKDKA